MLTRKFPPGWAGPLEGKDPWPLRFFGHSFGVRRYNVLGCSIIYNGYQFGTRRLAPEGGFVDEPSGPEPDRDWKRNWRGHHGIFPQRPHAPVFPSLVEMEWTSLDGRSHEYKIDLEKIFPDRLILHRSEQDELMPNWLECCSIDPVVPRILVELNDARVSVYMRALLITRLPQREENPYSNVKDDLVLAWSRSFRGGE